MDISLLKTFLQVAKTRHFGRAADALCVTQSAVSARIKLLESMVGTPLFVRKRNDIQLTSAGTRLVKHAETIVRNWDRARLDVSLDPEFEASIAIGCNIDIWQIQIHRLSVRLRQDRPNLVLQVEMHSADALVQRVLNGTLDLAYLFEPPQLAELDVKQILDVPLILVSDRPGLSTPEAMSKNYLMVDWGSSYAMSHAAYFPDCPAPTAYFGSGTMAFDILRSIGGSAYLAEQAVTDALQRREMFVVEDAPVIERRVFAIFRPGSERRAAVRAALAGFGEPVGSG